MLKLTTDCTRPRSSPCTPPPFRLNHKVQCRRRFRHCSRATGRFGDSNSLLGLFDCKVLTGQRETGVVLPLADHVALQEAGLQAQVRARLRPVERRRAVALRLYSQSLLLALGSQLHRQLMIPSHSSSMLSSIGIVEKGKGNPD